MPAGSGRPDAGSAPTRPQGSSATITVASRPPSPRAEGGPDAEASDEATTTAPSPSPRETDPVPPSARSPSSVATRERMSATPVPMETIAPTRARAARTRSARTRSVTSRTVRT